MQYGVAIAIETLETVKKTFFYYIICIMQSR